MMNEGKMNAARNLSSFKRGGKLDSACLEINEKLFLDEIFVIELPASE